MLVSIACDGNSWFKLFESVALAIVRVFSFGHWSEIDVVVNYKLIKNEEDHDDLKEEINKLTEYCHREGVIVKIIIETGTLNYQEIESICRMATDVDFIMTSTGKLPNDDSFETKLEKVKFMRKILPDEVKIKISGGIRTIEQVKDAKPFVDRIGTSSLKIN